MSVNVGQKIDFKIDTDASSYEITIFRLALCEAVDSREELVEQVAITVIHELAHHFGIDDARLHELGWG